jgi:hypothetical protein
MRSYVTVRRKGQCRGHGRCSHPNTARSQGNPSIKGTTIPSDQEDHEISRPNKKAAASQPQVTANTIIKLPDVDARFLCAASFVAGTVLPENATSATLNTGTTIQLASENPASAAAITTKPMIVPFMIANIRFTDAPACAPAIARPPRREAERVNGGAAAVPVLPTLRSAIGSAGDSWSNVSQSSVGSAAITRVSFT